ncbi:MAG: carboxypeptidase-like regulatory domain-containing protein, partial [Planctomycetota bacterium]
MLVDARCISAGEGWASWFVANKRARLFGEATAGASSRKTTYTLKNGLYKVRFPVKAYKGFLDRPIERRGLEPDVPIRQRAADLAAGRDTVLEAARSFLVDAAGVTAAEKAGPAETDGSDEVRDSGQETSEVTGVVLDADGKAVSGAQVTAYPLQKYEKYGPVTVATDEDGRFRTAMPVSRKDGFNSCLLVARNGRQIAMRRVHWYPGGPSFDPVTMALVPADGRVRGRLVDENGRAVRGADAVARIIRPDSSPARGRSLYLPSFPKFQRLFTAESDRNGAFTLENLPHGSSVVINLWKK